MNGRLVIVTGPPGAGKSTVARGLAAAWPAEAALHIHSDDLWSYFVKGRIPPSMPQSAAQNAVATEAMAAQAAVLAATFPVFFDGIVGPWFLDRFRDAARQKAARLDYLVLRPSREITVSRGVSREGHPMRDPNVIGQMWDQFSDLGGLESNVLDTSSQSTEQTIAVALEALLSNRHHLP